MTLIGHSPFNLSKYLFDHGDKNKQCAAFAYNNWTKRPEIVSILPSWYIVCN